MTTHRDLAEAAAYHRRRLVEAFVSGVRTHPHVEPPRPGRCLIGGLVLATALVAGTAASDAVTGHPSIRWHDVLTRIARSPGAAGGQPAALGTVTEAEAGPCLLVPTSRTTYVVRVLRSGTTNVTEPSARRGL
jgi:hypothetical protein